ncbi:MAG: leucine-rich repeat domain-containing protein [Clostridia bacterium]|nr:leucine-rich repeat domain-containing protein [Clostridia bacterium]
MKKKIIFISLMVALLSCLMVIGISAETPSNYIEFGARFPGSDEYITVYTQNAEDTSNPRIDFANCKFYSDVDFTQEVDMSTVTGIDFSVSKTYASGVQGKAPTRMVKPKAPYVNCTEVKWFTQEGAMDYVTPSSLFNGWSSLKSFDFGNLKKLGDNSFEGCGFEELVIPSTITHLYSRTFAKNESLKSVKFEGPTEFAGNAYAFFQCTALESVVLGNVTYIGKGTFSGCTALASIKLPSTVTEIRESVFSGCTALTIVDLSGVTNMVSIGKYAFSGCTSLSKIISSGVDQDGAVIIPEGVTLIDQEAFYNCDSIKYLSLPSTITKLGPSICRDSAALEFVDFNDNPNDINLDNWGHFNNCPSLKALSLPNNLKTLCNRFVNNCANLQAVYLPANLEQMNTNGNGQGPFCFNGKMYFVQKAFEVRDANGYFFGDKFKMPQKPELYYMPENFARSDGNVSSGTLFRDCASLNNVIVMPEAFTDSTVVQMFRGTASQSQRKTVVYLGKITNYAWSEMNKYIDFVFANKGNTDLSTLTFTAFYNRNNENCYFYFCSTGYKYTMAKASVDDIAATKEENQYWHVANPKETEETDATCTENKVVTTYCFCGEKIGTVEEENTALGHDHTIFIGLVYESFLKEGNYEYQCARCDDVNSEQKESALFTCQGYSASKTGNGISLGFKTNSVAIDNYIEVTGNTIKYGVFAVSQDKLKDGDIFGNDGSVADGVISFNIARTDFAGFDIKIIGFETDAQKDAFLALGAYVIVNDGENTVYSYMQADDPKEDNKYSFVTYNGIINPVA